MDVSALFEPAFWQPLLGALIGGAVALVAGAAVAWLVNTLAHRWATRTNTPLDDIVVNGLASPVRWLFPLSALFSAHPWFGLTDVPRTTIKHALVVAITLNVGWVFLRLIRIFEEIVAHKASAAGSLRARAAYTQVHGLSNVARFLIGLTTLGLVLLSFSAVREMGVSILASAGVVGIAVGFAAQKTLAAVVSGLVIAVAQPIRIDDAVVVEGELGTVEEINLTFVVVRLLDRRCIIVPINHFLEKPFQNWSRSSTQVRTNAEFTLDYSASLDLIRGELKHILDTSAHWDREYWELNVTGTSDRGMLVRATMSAADARKAVALRAEVRDKLVLFIQERCPNAFPKPRVEAVTETKAIPRATTNPKS